jgi:hypothetical protein
VSQPAGGDPPVDLSAAGKEGRRLLWRARVAAVAVATTTGALVLGIGFGARAAIHDDGGPGPSAPTTERTTQTTEPTTQTTEPTTQTTEPTTQTTEPTTQTTEPEDHPPEVSDVSVSPASIYTTGCDPSEAEVSAVVEDDRGLDSVTLRWSFDTVEGSTPMAGGPTFSGKLGPFESVENASAVISVTVEAIDTAGQVTQGATTAALNKCIE